MRVRLAIRSAMFFMVSSLVLTLAATATAGSSQTMRGLDDQVQEVKADVLSIAAELANLEEKLLHPSDTQLAVFVSMPDGQALEMDSAEIRIDGEVVAAHIYTHKELVAFERGGVQRIYTGNVTSGPHQIEVVISGRTSGGTDVERTRSFSFTKEVGPKLLEVSLSGTDTGEGLISLEQ